MSAAAADEQERAARELFTERFGGEPAGVWRAPGRVNLIGEHTDYNDGFVLPFAIDRSTTAAVALRDDRTVRVVSTFDSAVVEATLDDVAARAFAGWSAYPLGVAWAFGEAGTDLGAARGFDLALASDVPVGAGLSSSAAIEMAAAVALNDLWGVGADRKRLARLGQRAENIAVGAPTGIMDQSASVFGERDAAVFLDCRSLDVEQVRLGFVEAGLVLLVVDTRVEHAHATGGYKARREACERGAAAMGVPALRDVHVDDLARAQEVLDEETFRRVRHVVTEDDRVLRSVEALRGGDLAAFGALMLASHASMRDDFEISVPELDTVVEVAASNGAVGARMTGGGFGGAAIALIDADRAEKLADAVRAAFAERGFRDPVTFQVVPSAGARRID
jgi:galactokinase